MTKKGLFRAQKNVPLNKKGEWVESDSLSQKYLRNFWFRYLDPTKGWTPERIDMTVDLIMKMLNYWPDYRPTAEELYQHKIFQEKDGNEPILPKRNDAENIDNLVKLSNDQYFQAFQGKLAESHSKLFMKTKKSRSNQIDDNGHEANSYGSRTTIHEILTLEEKIEFGNNVRLKASVVIDKMATAKDEGMDIENLKFMQPEDQDDYSESAINLENVADFMKPKGQEGQEQYVQRAEEDDAKHFTAASNRNDEAAAGWGSTEVHTNDKGEHFQVFDESIY